MREVFFVDINRKLHIILSTHSKINTFERGNDCRFWRSAVGGFVELFVTLCVAARARLYWFLEKS